ncbi:MAG TPA: cbb3-type cytochrome c oxidase subunit II [Candidatus Avalokitesvara rifleensis]|uniref:cbb3-type cytochrome c oxidase subunit II n=1 Tax=Candidatus Avalokitesvara rifleensis TaxID=3367620 RepID=UPI00402734D3
MYTVLLLLILASTVICLGGIYYKKGVTVGILVPGVILLIIISFVSTAVLPYMGEIKPTPKGAPYTDKQVFGRQIYVREGCWYCHTQQVRPIRADAGEGEVSQPGDYVNDYPHVLGTERTGPDLTHVGGEYEDAWHRNHFANPRPLTPEEKDMPGKVAGSIMPSFSYLSSDETDALITYLQSLK